MYQVAMYLLYLYTTSMPLCNSTANIHFKTYLRPSNQRAMYDHL